MVAQFIPQRIVLFVFGGCLIGFLAFALDASAQETSNLGIGTLQIHQNADCTSSISQDANTLNEFFNLARCQCNASLRVEIPVTAPDATATNSYALVAGSGCLDNDNHLEPNCDQLDSGVVEEITTEICTDAYEARRLMLTASQLTAAATSGCPEIPNGTFQIAFYQTLKEDVNQYSLTGEALSYPVDTVPPDPPAKTAEPSCGQGLVRLSVGAPNGNDQDVNVEKYQLLCEKWDSNGQQWIAAGRGQEAEYDSLATLSDCAAQPAQANAALAAEVSAATEDNGTDEEADEDPCAGVDEEAASSVDTLAASYVCDNGRSAADEFEISGLDDSTCYRFFAVTIDPHRNPSELTHLGTKAPCESEDLWERYKRAGGMAEPGCTAGGGSPTSLARHPLVFTLLGCIVLVGIGFVWRRRGGRNQ